MCKSHIKENAASVRVDCVCPDLLIVHYDFKIIQMKSGVYEDRLAVVFSSRGNIKSQFAASPVIPNGGAEACAGVVQTVIDDWGVKTSIKAQVFDTPSVNTGHKTGVNQRMMEWLGHPILQLACRHHTGELHCLHAYLECRGKKYIRSDVNTLYKRLHTAWADLEPLIQNHADQLLKWEMPAEPDWRCDRRDEVLALG